MGLHIRLGESNGAFGQPISQQLTLQNSDGGGRLLRGDFNRDQRDDLILLNQDTEEITVLLNSCTAISVTNKAPGITPVAAEIFRAPGIQSLPVEIANVLDAETPPGNLQVTASAPADLYVTSLTNNAGRIFASIYAGCQLAPGRYDVTLRVTDAGGLSATTILPVMVRQNDISSNVSYFLSGLIYTRTTRTFNGTLRITNNAPQAISGPFRLELHSLTGGVTLANELSQRCGIPFVNLTGLERLEPGQTISVFLRFRNPLGALINYVPRLYVDSDTMATPAITSSQDPEIINRVSRGRFAQTSERTIQ